MLFVGVSCCPVVPTLSALSGLFSPYILEAFGFRAEFRRSTDRSVADRCNSIDNWLQSRRRASHSLKTHFGVFTDTILVSREDSFLFQSSYLLRRQKTRELHLCRGWPPSSSWEVANSCPRFLWAPLQLEGCTQKYLIALAHYAIGGVAAHRTCPRRCSRHFSSQGCKELCPFSLS